MPINTTGLRVESIRSDRLIVALPHDHPLAHGGSDTPVDLALLGGDDFIVHAGSGKSVMHGVLSAAAGRAGFVPRIRHEVEETSTLVTLVAAGVGVALVPEPTSALGIPGVVYRPLDTDDEVELAVAFPDGRQSPLVERALAVLRTLS